MTKLRELRTQISRLHRRRRTARLVTAACAIGLAVLWTLAALYLIDWTFELTRLQRVLVIALGLGAIAWATRKYALPWLAEQESELDVALLVEKQQKIDSDLVAALQFESPEARRWGSPELEDAVIDYVADFGKGWNLLEGFKRQQMTNRLAAAALSLALLGLAALLFPSHTAVFFSRLMLSSAHYPTKTRIERVIINDQTLAQLLPAGEITGSYPYGQPLRFAIVCSGVLPDDGRVELRTIKSGLETRVELQRAQPPTEGASSDSAAVHLASAQLDQGQAVYVGQLPRMLDSLYCQLYLGDAWTDPAQLQVLPLPAIEIQLNVTPPEYADPAEAPPAQASTRQMAVVEGSRVDLEVHCTNRKRLVEVTMVIDERRYPLEAKDETGEIWTVQTDKTPLARLDKPLSYRLEVKDEHGLSPQRPIVGFIRIQADRPPQIYGSLVTNHVLPSAQPNIGIRAVDDFGLARLLLHVEVTRETGGEAEEKTVTVLAPSAPLLRDKLPLRKDYQLDLKQFNLAKGDRVRVTLEAFDFRGQADPRSSVSDSLLLNVTDESGVLSAISESDERSARQLDAIIRRQLGIGGGQ